MQSLLSKALEIFVRDRHGEQIWAEILRSGDLEGVRFETFQRYRPETIHALNVTTAARLGVEPDALMEDLGTWVCTTPRLEPVRRLIRFSGDTFEDMLYSLDTTKDRVNLAMPGLDIPDLSLTENGEGAFVVTCRSVMPGAGAFMLGVLRAMADDYGALALVDLLDRQQHDGQYLEEISVQLLARDFSTPRDFRLGGVA